MIARYRCRVSGAWSGWIETENGRRDALAETDTDVTPDAFPGRWSPVRAFPDALEPLPAVVGTALARAGTWSPGAGTSPSGGVIVGADGAYVAPSTRFARAIAPGYSAQLSPTDFIHALPSTAASLLTKLYGFADYQATVVEGARSGARALAHALDLMATGRLESTCVAVLSAARSPGARARLAAALYLEPLESAAGGAPVELGVPHPPPAATAHDDALADRLRAFGALAALPLVHLAIALGSSEAEPGSPFLLARLR